MIVILIIIIIIIIKSFITKNNALTKINNGTVQMIIPASSLATSTNPGGSNFAYSIWFYISDWNYRYGEEKILFGRMNQKTSTDDTFGSLVNKDEPAPLVYLGSISNDINVILTVYNETQDTTTPISESVKQTIPQSCIVQNIPIQRWVNFTMSVYGRTLDMYINGKLVRTCILPGVAYVDQTTDVILTPLGGFQGTTSKLAYYSNSLNPEQVWNIYENGYGSSILSNIFGAHQLNISLSQNGQQEASITI